MDGKHFQSGMNRRKFLSYAGASIGSLGLPMAGTASAQTENPGAEEIGIHNDVRELITNGNHAEAHNLLEENDVEFDTNKQVKYVDNGGDVGTDAVWSKDTVVINDSYHLSGNRYHSVLSWDPAMGRPAIDGRGPKDAASLTVSDALWEPMQVWTSHQRVSLDERGPYGYLAKVNDNYNVNGFFEAEFKKLQSGKHKIFGTFAHSWSVGGVNTGSFTVGIGAGPLSFSTSGTIDAWKQRSDAYL